MSILTVVNVEDKGFSDVYDLHIDHDDHSYHIEDIKVHNSEVCAKNDGMIFKKKIDEIPMKYRPPVHWQCRSRLLFVPYDHKSMNIRAGIQYNKDGIGKGAKFTDLTYESWFKLQPAKIQIGWLGKKRYELYKTGKYKITDLVNSKTDRFFSIKDLEKLGII